MTEQELEHKRLALHRDQLAFERKKHMQSNLRFWLAGSIVLAGFAALFWQVQLFFEDRRQHGLALQYAQTAKALADAETLRIDRYLKEARDLDPATRLAMAETYAALAMSDDAIARWQAAVALAQDQVKSEQAALDARITLQVEIDEILSQLADGDIAPEEKPRLQTLLSAKRTAVRQAQELILRLNPRAVEYDLALTRPTVGSPDFETAHNHDIELVRPLLDLIGDEESGGNYNAYFGHPTNEDAPRLTDMTLREVAEFQQQLRVQGAASSAVGKYQIIRKTLLEMIEKWGHNPEQQFTAEFQDRLALQMMEGRGLSKWLGGNRTTQKFAHSLARQWAVLPVLSTVSGSRGKVKRGQSYYSGDGLNKAKVTAKEFEETLDRINPES